MNPTNRCDSQSDIAAALRVLRDPQNQQGIPSLPPGATLAQVQELRSQLNTTQLAAYDHLKSTGSRDWFDRTCTVDLALANLETAIASRVRVPDGRHPDDWLHHCG